MEGGEDPPTRLIGNFLRKQRESGAKPSLDVGLDMEELGRPPQHAQRVSFEDEHQKHVSSSSSDSGSDAGEVVRRKSTSTAAGPLLRTKTRSRLTDPPPAAAAPAVDEKPKSSASRPPKPGQSPRMSGPMDWEEEDPFVDEDIPDGFNSKRGKLDALTILQWVSLLLIIGALVCSASIRILSKKMVWGLHLWKWELLVLTLLCGRLVSGWVIRIAMLCFGRNLLLRKRVLYFVYGVRSAVQNMLWLGLVLASWHFLFDNKSQVGHMAVVSYVMKILFCLLVATLIRLVKTLLLKVLASSFHVSTYFDRIQGALFNQYLAETLSGPQLVDQEASELHAAMPTKNLSGQRSIRTSGSMGQGSQQLSGERRQHQIDEGISIDKLHRLNRRNVSAWNMKRLMKIGPPSPPLSLSPFLPLRVPVRSSTARARIFAAGDAGRRRDGGGALCSVVDCSSSFDVSLGDLGFMPASGVMPMECSPPSFACSGWWSLATSSSLPPWWRRRERGGFGASSPNKHAVAFGFSSDLVVWFSPDPFSAGRRGGGSGEEGRELSCRGLKSIHPWSSTPAASVLECWRLPTISSPWSNFFGGRRPAAGTLLLHLLVEWQPSFISSRPERLMGGRLTLGRRPCLTSSASRWRCCCGELITPSGFVPGGNRLGSVLQFVVGIELQFTFQIWGPYCKMQGLVCNLVSTLCPCVMCECTVSINI